MRYGKLMLGTMVMASMLGLAACADSAGSDMGGSAGLESGAVLEAAAVSEASGATSVGDILAGMKPTERLDAAVLEKSCTDPACQADWEEFKTFLATKCAAQAGCDYKAALLLYLQRTRQQVAAGMIPSTFPQVADVTKAYEESGKSITGGEEGSSGGSNPSAPGDPAMGDNPIDAVIAKISAEGGAVTMPGIESMLQEANPAGAVAAVAAIKTALAGIQPNSDVRPIAERLLKGEEVSATEAVMALKEAAGSRSSGGAGSGAAGGGAAAADLKALAPVVAALSGAMGSREVSWEDLKELIAKEDSSGALVDEVQKAMENMPPSSEHAPIAEMLVKGEMVAGTDAGLLLQSLISGR